MSSRAQHFREAERLLDEAQEHRDHIRSTFDAPGMTASTGVIIASLVATAQVHATLASIGDGAFDEYLDLTSVERLREEVANTPDADSRDWLIADPDDE